MTDASADRDLQVQLARLEHAVAQVADDDAAPDDQVAAAEQAAGAAADAGGAFDRLLREADGRSGASR